MEHIEYHNELFKYKQSFYLIKNAIKLIKNHYYDKINNIDTLRIKERKKVSYLKRKNIVLEDKCTFYSEHVDELEKIYTEHLNKKNEKIQNVQDNVDKNGKFDECKFNAIRTLKLREDQLENFSKQLNMINDLYHKQVDNNKNLIAKMEKLNKRILYLNYKVQEEKKNTENIKKKFKFYKRYTKNKRNFKLNFDTLNQQEEKNNTEINDDICMSILCVLKTELEIIDDENKNKKKNKNDQNKTKEGGKNLFKKLLESSYKSKKVSIFDEFYKKRFFSFYEKNILGNEKVKFENRKLFYFPLNFKKKISSKCDKMHNTNIKNIETSDEESKKKFNKNSTWNYLLNSINFYNNLNNDFDHIGEHLNSNKEEFKIIKVKKYEQNGDQDHKNSSNSNYINNEQNIDLNNIKRNKINSSVVIDDMIINNDDINNDDISNDDRSNDDISNSNYHDVNNNEHFYINNNTNTNY